MLVLVSPWNLFHLTGFANKASFGNIYWPRLGMLSFPNLNLGEFGAQNKVMILDLVREPKWSLGNYGFEVTKPYEIGVHGTPVEVN